MPKGNFHTTDEYLASLSENQRPVVNKLRKIFLSQEGITEKLKRERLHYKYPNGMWVYITVRPWKPPALWVSRGAKMIKMYPMLAGIFDEVMRVVGKIMLPSVESIEAKWVPALADLCAQMPKWMGVV